MDWEITMRRVPLWGILGIAGCIAWWVVFLVLWCLGR